MRRAQGLAASACVLLLTAIGAPGQVRVGEALRINTGTTNDFAGETTIVASPANPREWLAGWIDNREGLSLSIGIGVSRDGGATWTEGLLQPPPQFQSVLEADPMTAADPRTGTLWVGGISTAANGGIFVSRKDPGAAWVAPPVMVALNASFTVGLDKALMAAGPLPGAPDTTRVYVAANVGLFASDDLGATWSGPRPLPPGIGHVPRVGPGGELYDVYWNLADRIELVRSLDGGLSVGAPVLVASRMDWWGLSDHARHPGVFRMPPLPAFAVDPRDGTLYCVFTDTTDVVQGNANLDLYLTRSDDGGLTWSAPTVINRDGVPHGDQFMPWLEVDAAGRLHVVCYDTRYRPLDDDESFAWLDVTYLRSADGGATWRELRLTEEPFDSRTNGTDGHFMGDYQGLSSVGQRTLPIYMTGANAGGRIWVREVLDGPAAELCHGLGCPCGNDDPSAGCGNLGHDLDPSSGARLAASGSDELALDDLELVLTRVAPGAPGFVFAGPLPATAVLGDGLRCVGGAGHRFPPRVADAAGALRYGPGELVGQAAGALLAGATWHYQAWYRDAGGPCGSGANLSSALSVTWR